VWVSLDCCVFPSPLQIWCCVANLTYKDVARLQVSVQHWWLACVEVQHAPGDAANHGHQLGRVPSGRRTVVQHHIQSPSRAVLHDQVQIVPMLTQTPQAHYVVMRPCRMQTSYLGLFVCMQTRIMLGSVCMHSGIMLVSVCLHGDCTAVSGCEHNI